MSKWLSVFSIVCYSCTFLWLGMAWGQSKNSAEWSTNGGDPQRSGWQKNETRINTESVKNLQLLWSAKTDNKPISLAALVEPLIVSGINTPSGTKTLAILAGSSDNLYAIDADTGAIVWQKHFAWSSDTPPNPMPQMGFLCEDALTASPVADPPGGSGPRYVYTLTIDGYLHTVNLATGEEKGAPIKVLPKPNGKPYGLNIRNNIVYTITGQGCGGNPNSVFAVDLASRETLSLSPSQAGIWGVSGPAIGSDGTVYAETGDGPYDAAAKKLSTSVLAVSPDDVEIKDYYTPTNHQWLTQRDLDMNFTPVIFPYKGRELLVASGKEGRYFLLDTKSLGGADHATPLYKTPLISNTNINFQTEGSWGGAATWEDKSGTRWIFTPIGGPTNPEVKIPISYGPIPDGGVLAMKIEDRNGNFELVPAWVSRNMVTAETPAVTNGVVFAVAAGEFTLQAHNSVGGIYSAPERVAKSVPAKLYALDAVTGKELWSSGDQVKSFLHQSGLALAGSRVIFGTNDGTVYCFGLK
jgi:outer membrane protein assembly factor BamB